MIHITARRFYTPPLTGYPKGGGGLFVLHQEDRTRARNQNGRREKVLDLNGTPKILCYGPKQEARLFCGSFPRKGEVFSLCGRIQNFKILKERHAKEWLASIWVPSSRSNRDHRRGLRAFRWLEISSVMWPNVHRIRP